MAKAYNKKVRSRVFKEEDLVLKKILPASGEHQNKWALNYEGLYMVKKVFFSRWALILTKMDEGDLPKPINYDIVKKCHA